jgi:hypothetical protein
MSPSGAEAGLTTARALLSADRVGVTLDPVPPDPSLEQLGALAGFGAVVAGHDVRVNVYVLDAWGRGHDHVEALKARAEANGRRLCAAVNGELLFVGTAAEGDESARFVLNDLCSAFAGWE